MQLGDEITLELLKEEGEEIQVFSSEVVKKESSKLYISYPINITTARISMFLEGTPFTITYKGKDDIIYSFQSEVISREKVSNIPVLVLHLPNDELIMKVQRRQFLRIQTQLDVAVHHKNNDMLPFTTRTFDISGGGVAIILPKAIDLKKDDLVDLWIVLPFKTMDYHYISVTGKVIRQIIKEKSIKIASLEFQTIKDHDRDMIIRYCFQKQLEQKEFLKEKE